MRTLLVLTLLLAVSFAQTSNFGSDISVNGKRTLDFPGGVQLEVEASGTMTVRIDLVLNLEVELEPDGYNLLLGQTESAVAFKVTFTPENNMVSARLRSPTLSLSTVTSLLAATSGNVAGAVRYDANAKAYTWIDADNYELGDLNITIELPGSGQYSFMARAKNAPIVRLYQEEEEITSSFNKVNFGNELTVVLDIAATATADLKATKLTANPFNEEPEGELKGFTWFHFDASGSADQISKATLEFKYEAEALVAAGIEDASSLTWYVYDEAEEAWVESATNVDANAKVVTTTSTEFIAKDSGTSSRATFAIYGEVGADLDTAGLVAPTVALCLALSALLALLL